MPRPMSVPLNDTGLALLVRAYESTRMGSGGLVDFETFRAGFEAGVFIVDNEHDVIEDDKENEGA